MSKIFQVTAPFEFSIACSARFRRSSETMFLPVISPSEVLSIAGRAIPEYSFLSDDAKEELLPSLKFAKRQYSSNFTLSYSAAEFYELTERMRTLLNFPVKFEFCGGVRIGTNNFRKVSTAQLGTDCISLYGEEECLLVRDTLDKSLRAFGLEYRAIPIYIGGVQSEWTEIVPEFLETPISLRTEIRSGFFKGTEESSLFVSVGDHLSTKEFRALLFPLQLSLI